MKTKYWPYGIALVAVFALAACSSAPATPTSAPSKATVVPAAAATTAPAAVPTSAPAPATAVAQPAAATPAAQQPAVQTITWKMPTHVPQAHFATQAAEKLASVVKDRSGGRLQIQVFPGGQLVQTAEIGAAVSKGQVQIAQIAAASVGDLVPVGDVASLPFLWQYGREKNVLEAGLRQAIDAQLDKQGMRSLIVSTWGPVSVYSRTKPVSTLADWKGLKIRTYGKVSADVSTAWGASVVNVAIEELYSALQRGIADAAWATPAAGLTSKTYEVTKYLSVGSFGAPINFYLVNKQAFDGLPSDLKQILTKAAAEIEDELWPIVTKEDQAARTALVEKGMVINEVSPAAMEEFRKIVLPLAEQWAQKLGADGATALKAASTAGWAR